MQANEAAWYDEFYQQEQKAAVCWYNFSLPALREILTPQSRLLELGCGQGHLLRRLAAEKLLPQENIYGLDQSRTAVDYVKHRLPQAHLDTGDIYQLPYEKNFFDVCMLMETIEHLEDPQPALEQIFSVLAPGGRLFVSFPNFGAPFWLWYRQLLVRLKLAERYIALQPIDKIYDVPEVIAIVERAAFKFDRGIGSGYGPPVLYRLEMDWMTRWLNALGCWRRSFHPILIFRKPAAPSAGPGPSLPS